MIGLILGIGIDLVEVERFRRTLDDWQDSFRRRVFTAGELSYARVGNPWVEAQRLGARFAAKEAWIKASGIAIAWTQIEVAHEQRAPRLVLHGPTREEAGRRGIVAVHLSITHTHTTAGAVVVVEGAPPVSPTSRASAE